MSPRRRKKDKCEDLNRSRFFDSVAEQKTFQFSHIYGFNETVTSYSLEKIYQVYL